MLFVAIMKGDVYLSSFSSHLSSVYRRATDLLLLLLLLILYPTTLLMVFITCSSSLVEVLGSLMNTIISSANSESLTFFLSNLYPLDLEPQELY